MSKNLIKKAKIFATKYHEGQYRKYTNDPYIVHPIAVSQIVKTVKHTDNMICVALLHDTVEDTIATIWDVEDIFGEEIATMVEMLTDVSKKSDGNRFIRRQIDLAHTAIASPEAKTIKLADLIDNTYSIVKHDKDFAKVYLHEKLRLLEVLQEGDTELWVRANTIANEGLSML
jgi:(p)ppGpp synthase/HD superfamily hydrolase